MNSYASSAARCLKAKYVNVPSDWLEACIEWISEENQGNLPPQHQVNELVFEQWLLSDLHELGTQCLPQEITEAKYKLNGTFALQIDSLVDISKSCYSQLQKIAGTENANAEVSAETNKPWEPKPTRMLLLKLTDGTTNVQGMEYRPISCLNSNTKPGCKILVKGNILCRHGMLMLKAENISVLGGEVDGLIETVTPENVLKQTLETNITNADKQYKTEFEGGPTINTKIEVNHTPQNNRSQLQNRNLNNFSSNRNTGPSQVKVKPKSPVSFDEFEEDIPLDALMDDMDGTDDNRNITNQFTANDRNFESPGNLSTTGTNIARGLPRGVDNFSDHNRNVSNNKNNIQHARQQLSSNSRQGLSNSKPLQNQHPVSVVKEENVIEMSFMDDDFDDDFDVPVVNKNNTSLNRINNRPTSNPINSKKRQLVSPVENANNSSNKRRSLITSPDLRDDFETFDHLDSSNHVESSRKMPLFSTPSENRVKSERTKTSFGDDIEDFDIDLGIDLGLEFLADDGVSDKSPKSLASQEVDLNYDPWTYLSVVKKNLPTQQLICFKVKAFISTLTGKLESPDGKRWCLPVKINDGTASMDVDLSNKVLTDLIGFSAPESQILRKMVKTNPQVKEKLTKGIKGCQQKLIELLCIMEITISPHVSRPEVTSLIDITTADISVLADRLTKSVGKSK